MVLERLIVNGKPPQKLAARARIVLLSGRGVGTMAIAPGTRVELGSKLPVFSCAEPPEVRHGHSPLRPEA